MSVNRRSAIALAALASALLAPSAFAQAKLKVAAIYTVPVEQQWVSRIDKALKAAVTRGEIEYVFSENVANADYERVMRQYAEKGHTLIVGESFAVEAAARKVAKDYPKISFLMGSSGKPQEPNFSGLRQLHPGAGLPERPDRRRHEQERQDRHGRRLPHPRSQPPDERLHGRRERGQPQG
jgi:basic membrane lipoprotein Med (substrate-binding protein (PBP1-ABC) superfamily)